jgi:hypothetical protein
MATCAHSGQAVGLAAALCARDGLSPRDLVAPARMAELQRRLIRAGQFIPEVALRDNADLAARATVTASSTYQLSELPAGPDRLPLTDAWAMLLPVPPGPMPAVTFTLDVATATELIAELRVSSKLNNHTPDVTLATLRVALTAGAAQAVTFKFPTSIDAPRYAFVCLAANPAITAHLSDQRLTGVLSVTQKFNRAVAKSPRQEPPPGTGIESFEFWIPQRRPGGKNFALRVEPAIALFAPENLRNGFSRPTNQPNVWLAALTDAAPTLTLEWPEPVELSRLEFDLDADFDHPLETVLMLNPETVAPFCVPALRVLDDTGRLVGELRDQHLSQAALTLAAPLRTRRLTVQLTRPASGAPAALFRVSAY